MAEFQHSVRRLGLEFQLFSCEVRFNRGLSLIYSVSLLNPLSSRAQTPHPDYLM